MNILLIIIAVIAIILLLTGGFVSSLNFLLWVGIVLLIIAAIVFLVRMLTGSRRVCPNPPRRCGGGAVVRFIPRPPHPPL